MNFAIIGATGNVGRKTIEVLENSKLVVDNLFLIASKRSAGQKLFFKKKEIIVEQLENYDFSKAEITIFAAGSEIAKKWAFQASKKTIVITPVPTYSENIAESYLYKKYVWGDEITLDKSKWDDYIKKTKEYLISSSKENTFFLNSEEVFCNTSLNKCFASKDNEIFYTDNNHLSIEGSELLIEEIIFMLNN